MNCPVCGAEITNDDKFCPLCGAKIDDVQEEQSYDETTVLTEPEPQPEVEEQPEPKYAESQPEPDYYQPEPQYAEPQPEYYQPEPQFQPQYQQPQYQQPQYQQPLPQPQYQPQYNPPVRPVPDNESSALGILSIVFGCIPGMRLIGLIIGLVGNSSCKKPENKKLCKIGAILSGVFIVLEIIGIILYFVFIVGLVAFSEMY